MKRVFPELVFDSVVPRNVRLAESPSFGKPVLLYDIKSRGLRGVPRRRPRAAQARNASARAARTAPAASWHKPPRPPLTRANSMPARHQGRPHRRTGSARWAGAWAPCWPTPARPVAASAAGVARLPLEQIHPDRANPRRTFDEAAAGGARRLAQEPGRAAAHPGAQGRQGRLPHHRRRATVARGPEGRPQGDARHRARGHRRRGLRAGAGREHPAADLNPLEEAEAFRRLVEERSSPRSRWPTAWARTARRWPTRCGCWRLPNEVKQLLAEGDLDMGHARAMLGLSKAAEMVALGPRGGDREAHRARDRGEGEGPAAGRASAAKKKPAARTPARRPSGWWKTSSGGWAPRCGWSSAAVERERWRSTSSATRTSTASSTLVKR